MAKIHDLSASMEDYLEAIYHILSEKQAVRAKDIAKRLNVNNSSVTGALRSLAEKELVNYAPYDVITLTEKGNGLAGEIARKHEALQDFFINVLSIDKTEAVEAACKMEHALSPTILERLIRFMEFVESCPRGGEKWISHFEDNCNYIHGYGGPYLNCETCIGDCLDDFQRMIKNRENSGVTVLKELNPGAKGKIMKIIGKSGISKRLAELDITRGNMIEVEGVSRDGQSLDIKVRGYHLSLDSEESSKIMIESYG